MRPRTALALAAAAALALPAAAAGQGAQTPPPQPDAADPRPPLALMGTLPLYWGEAGALEDILAGTGAPHWARPAIERGFALQPLDYLSAEALAGHDYLLLAQPRGLAPEENVALDDFVRAGGRVLLFADPLLTGESRFAVGDRRRPQEVALLSPILTHWGLVLRFDETAPGGGARMLAQEGAAEVAVPVDRAGLFEASAPGCAILAAGLVARCALGQGTALLVADAALLDLAAPPAGSCAALAGLLRAAFGDAADSVGCTQGDPEPPGHSPDHPH